MVEIRRYLGIFPIIGGFILLFSIYFPAAIYDKGSGGYLKIMAWGWMVRIGVWDYGMSWGFIDSNLVMWLGIAWIVGLILCAFIMIFIGSYYTSKLSSGALDIKDYKLLGISCGILVTILPIIWMIGVDLYFSMEPYFYIVLGISFLKDLNPYGPTICSLVIGPLNTIMSILITSKRS